MEHIIERVKTIVLSPKEALTAVKTEEMPVVDTMKRYVAIIAAIPPAAQFIGYALVGLPLVGRLSFGRSLLSAILLFVANLIVVVVFGKIITALAPNFNATKNDAHAFKLSVYSLTPGFVAGIFYIIPSLSPLSMIGGLYGIYVLYLGIPILTEAPQEKAVAYTVVSLLLAIVLFVVLGMIVSAIAWGGGAGSVRYF